jgi:hypothetical protein
LIRLGESCQQQQQQSISQTKSPSKPKRTGSSRFHNESKPGVFTSAKSFLDKDKEIVKKILKGVQLRRPAEVQTALLRRYFLELTQVGYIVPNHSSPPHHLPFRPIIIIFFLLKSFEGQRQAKIKLSLPFLPLPVCTVKPFLALPAVPVINWRDRQVWAVPFFKGVFQ